MFAKVNRIEFSPHDLKLPTRYSCLSNIDKKVIRERYIDKQNGKCFYCNNKLNTDPPTGILKLKVHKSLYPKGFFNRPVHLHHNHDTDMTIGAVHAYCNAVLWEYENE